MAVALKSAKLIGKFLYETVSGSFEVKRKVGGKDFYKNFKSNQLDEAKKYRDSIIEEGNILKKLSDKRGGAKSKLTKEKRYDGRVNVTAANENKRVLVNKGTNSVKFKNPEDQKQFGWQ